MKPFRLIAAGLALAFLPSARADLATYYVGRDTAVGTNQGHLTFLRAHGDHFHRLGPFGGVEGRIPEVYVGGQLALFAGEGTFAGRFVSGEYETVGSEVGSYSDLETRAISTLVGFPAGSEEATLLGGGQRYLGDLSSSVVALELVSISAGLGVYDAAGGRILGDVGDRYTLGGGDSFAAFTPNFATDLGLAPGNSYTATFRLVDLNGAVGESGTFRYEFRAVPEPASLAMLGTGGAGLLGYIRRRKTRTA